ncbi:hypothetical protein RchiOBHm_Chr5g0005651 [Rosa chinensis]|uniref:RNase H type-1 domain-containing protein n=1 Tax=Rosa chinensis TaxID=74649 RepID=A0A2P6Q3B8_ROSCH|nr:hypothetical protein RchiOBHm_Chr5g0005651 [Rosa chinensis]
MVWGTKPTIGRLVKPWSPPPVGWLKANIDGAFDQATHTVRLGVVIRDATGTVVAGACEQCDHVWSPLVVEALASRLACSVVTDNHLAPVIFESDCLQLVQAIRAESDDRYF